MKPLRELTIEDLRRVPVWRIISGDCDATANVEPSLLESLTEDTTEVFIVRTIFILNDGLTILGYCSPRDDSGLDYTQPVIICGTEQVPLFHERVLQEPELDALYRKLGRSVEDIFPLRLRAEVPVDGQFYETIIKHVHTL